MVQAKAITTNTGKELLERIEATGRFPSELVEAEGLGKVSDAEALRGLARQVLAENPEQVAQFRAGKATLIGWFVCQVMKRSGGKADPERTRELLTALLPAQCCPPLPTSRPIVRSLWHPSRSIPPDDGAGCRDGGAALGGEEFR